MRKACVCVVCVSAALLCSAAWAQDAAEIVSRAVEALGGPGAIAKWTDYEAAGEVTYAMFGREFVGDIQVITKGESSARQVIERLQSRLGRS